MDVTLVCDNMASTVMRQGRVQAVLVGCDRVAVNGDTANKIGTSGGRRVGEILRYPVLRVGSYFHDRFACPTGEQIQIEERAHEEVTEKWYARRMAPEGVKVYNPAFDVTPAALITAIITEQGIAYPPFENTLRGWKEKTF